MILLFVVVLVVAYAIAASQAVCHGLGRLWLTASVALLLILVGGVLLGRYYAVPSLSRLLLYAVALTGPVVLVPTTMLSFSTPGRPAWARVFPTAVAGACLGLVFGYVIVVFGLPWA